MRRSFAAALFLCALMVSGFASSEASASRSYGVDNCTQHGCTEIKTERVRVYRPAKKARTYTVRSERARGRKSAPGHLVSIQCGPKTIRVANSAAAQFAGFCRDLYAQHKFRAVGGWRRGPCSTASKHPCGGAVDISQSCRSKGPGHCLPRDFPVALTERLADKYGLHPGSRWGYRDVGHFETRGTLAGNGKWKAGESVAAKIEEPAPLDDSKQGWPRVLPQTVEFVRRQQYASIADDHSPLLDESPFTASDMPSLDNWEIAPFKSDKIQTIVRAESTDYLCGVYARTPVKKDRSGDFTWKDIFSAKRIGKNVCDYVIGGMAPRFRDALASAGREMDNLGIRWSILSGFRDDYRQRIAVGFKARPGNSLHGGSRAVGGFGKGVAADLVVGETDIETAGNWIARHGRRFGLVRPMAKRDPAHVQLAGYSSKTYSRSRYAKKRKHYRARVIQMAAR